jgi:TonB family protein
MISQVCPAHVLSQPVGGIIPVQSASASYANTSDGLQQLLLELLRAARSDDQVKLRGEIAAMEIPDYQNWFVHAFGQEQGQKLGDKYEESLKVSELHFEMLWAELAKQQGVISVEKLDQAKSYALAAGSLNAFRANWRKTDDSAGPDSQSIGVFYFVDGKFRLDGSPYDLKILSAHRSGQVVPAKLVNRIPPVYPPLARQTRIQGTVAVNVIVRKDGTVEVQNVGAGHPLLAQAAVDSVRQWRYTPTTINGDPVDVQTKIYVVFALTK